MFSSFVLLNLIILRDFRDFFVMTKKSEDLQPVPRKNSFSQRHLRKIPEKKAPLAGGIKVP